MTAKEFSTQTTQSVEGIGTYCQQLTCQRKYYNYVIQ